MRRRKPVTGSLAAKNPVPRLCLYPKVVESILFQVPFTSLHCFSQNNKLMKHMKYRMIILVACFTILFIPGVSSAQAGETIFKQKCTPCHTIGKGKLIGPDLKGVTLRREEAWLFRQIKEPDKMIAEADSIATQLVKDVGGIAMAPLGLSDDEIQTVIAFLKSIEQQETNISVAVPSQYWPTLLISTGVLLLFTIIALRAGKKQVDVV
jgi:cytochrome c2